MSSGGDVIRNYNEFLRWKPGPNYAQYSLLKSDKKAYWVQLAPEVDDIEKKEDLLTYEYAELIEKKGEKSYTVKLIKNGQELNVKEIYPVNNPQKDGIGDCAELPELSEPTVLHNLKVRYDSKVIYTYSGLFLVAVNPYDFYPIYDKGMVKYYENKRKEEIEPHVYALSDFAYRSLKEEDYSQSMLITGESGAGKTENTKKVIQYLAAIAGGSEHAALSEQLLNANPLLEAIGNAKTNRNHNSSRFGKFIKITFDPKDFQISGASIDTYLLERSRVIRQLDGERNFHIFYQIMAGLPSQKKQELFLTSPQDFEYLWNGSHVVSIPELDDVKLFQETQDALNILEFTPDEQDTFYRTCAAVLHLGQIKFDENSEEKASLTQNDKNVLRTRIATLLRVNPADLEQALVSPRSRAGNQIFTKDLSKVKAIDSRDALAKALYGRMFLWVVQKINNTLKVKNHKYIGILDIAGFEIFKFNTFEQLCINYTNENLQQFFNDHMFILEQEEYKREQINWDDINFGMDCKPTINFISKSLLPILDDLSSLSQDKIKDTDFMQRLIQSMEKRGHPCYRRDNIRDDPREFSIVHYAGVVRYNTENWIIKNKDPLQADIENTIANSTDRTLKMFFSLNKLNKTADDEQSQKTKSEVARSGSKTVSQDYLYQLHVNLLETLRKTTPHFIRCILPNKEKKKRLLIDGVVLHQLKCNGVVQGIQISREGFPNRLKYPIFLKRYYLLGKDIPPKAPGPDASKAAVQALVKQCVDKGIGDMSQIQFGVSKIFFRVGELTKFEEARITYFANLIPSIQSLARGYISRKLYQNIQDREYAVMTIQRSVRAWINFKTWSWFKLFIASRPHLQKEDINKLIADKEGEVAAVNKSLTTENEERDKLAKALSALEQKLNEFQEEINKEKQRYIDMQNKLGETSETNIKLDNQFKDLQQNLRNQQDMIKETESLIKEYKSKITDAE